MKKRERVCVRLSARTVEKMDNLIDKNPQELPNRSVILRKALDKFIKDIENKVESEESGNTNKNMKYFLNILFVTLFRKNQKKK